MWIQKYKMNDKEESQEELSELGWEKLTILQSNTSQAVWEFE